MTIPVYLYPFAPITPAYQTHQPSHTTNPLLYITHHKPTHQPHHTHTPTDAHPAPDPNPIAAQTASHPSYPVHKPHKCPTSTPGENQPTPKNQINSIFHSRQNTTHRHPNPHPTPHPVLKHHHQSIRLHHQRDIPSQPVTKRTVRA